MQSFFVSTNQNPEFPNPQWNQSYLMKARIVKKNGINEKLFPALQNIFETPRKCVYKQNILLLVK